MIGSEDAHLVGDDVGVREPCCSRVSGSSEEVREKHARRQRVRMVGTEVTGLIAHQLFEGGDRSARVAVLAEGIGLTGPRRERPSIRRSQELGHVRKEPLELGQGAGGGR